MDPVDLSLACRLLHACHCMYNLGPGGITADPYYAGVGFKREPVQFFENTLKVDSCMVGESTDGVVLAFRGTLIPQLDHIRQRLRDWINDLKMELMPSTGLPGKVHAGLGRSQELLWPDFCPVVENLVMSNAPLYITGHSKGALLACYAAIRLQNVGIKVKAVYTFASERVGDADFAAAYSKEIATHWRFEAYDDIFPHLPLNSDLARVFVADLHPHWDGLASEGYQQVGTLQYIDWDDQIKSDSEELQARRILHLTETIARLQWNRFYYNHYIPTGYAPVICAARPAAVTAGGA